MMKSWKHLQEQKPVATKDRAAGLRFSKVLAEKRLQNRFKEFERNAKLRIAILDKEKNRITAEMLHTYRARVDASAVYIGVIPNAKRPRLKPLPCDKEHIQSVVEAKQRRWKRREALSITDLMKEIDTRLDKIRSPKEQTTPPAKKNHFLVPLASEIKKLTDEDKRVKEKRTGETLTLPEIMNLVDANRIQNRRQKHAQKHLEDKKLISEEPELTEAALNRGSEYLHTVAEAKERERKHSITKATLAAADTMLPPLQRVPRKDNRPNLSYAECSRARYLRRGTPTEKKLDLSGVFLRTAVFSRLSSEI